MTCHMYLTGILGTAECADSPMVCLFDGSLRYAHPMLLVLFHMPFPSIASTQYVLAYLLTDILVTLRAPMHMSVAQSFALVCIFRDIS